MNKVRCAIYTRKSSEEGLDQEFNSLHAQREACEAYIASQKHEGWKALSQLYDDGGISGGTLERPALERLMQDIDEGMVDQIVVYKIDRLTRSLPDFARLVDRLDAADASFVSVTQSFNTATSMGRLTLNVLLSFAQFEREVTAERIRDKIAASKKKGLWMGGHVPLGFEADGRTLRVNKEEAKTVRVLYDLYLQHGTIRGVKEDADALKLRSKSRTSAKGNRSGGIVLDRGHIYQILTNPIYVGRIRHHSKVYEGMHEGIVEQAIWDNVQVTLQENASRKRGSGLSASEPSLLLGKIFDDTGDRLTPSHSNKKGRRYRYYISRRLVTKAGEKDLSGWRLPAKQLEQQIAEAIKRQLSIAATPAMVTSLTSDEIIAIKTMVEKVTSQPEELFDLVDQIRIEKGSMCIQLDKLALARLLSISPNRLEAGSLQSKMPFQMRKRGVETKMIFEENTPELDETLIRNIAKANQWLDEIKSGKTLDEIASVEKTSKRRVQQVTEWALLAPDIVRMIVEGRQPVGFTSNWLMRHNIPNDWCEQRKVISSL